MKSLIFTITAGVIISLSNACLADAVMVKDLSEMARGCRNLSGHSQRFAEQVAERWQVSVNSISVLRATWNGGICDITVDTPKGPKSCSSGTIMKNNSGGYFVGAAVCW